MFFVGSIEVGSGALRKMGGRCWNRGLFSPLTGKYADLMVINGYEWLVGLEHEWMD